jgi:hypothetical protein
MVSNARAGIGLGFLVGLAISFLLVLMATAPAQAQTVDECQAEIAQARALLTDPINPDYVDSFTNEKDRTGLIGKLDSVSAKLAQGKTQDALANLVSVRDKVGTLVVQGKLDPADADVLLAEVNEAIACVEGLQAQTRVPPRAERLRQNPPRKEASEERAGS